jgi:signal transduction histidine kinase
MRGLDPGEFLKLIAIALRWLVLVCLGAGLLLAGVESSAAGIILLVAGIWNAVLSALLLKDRLIPYTQVIQVSADLLIANLLLFSSIDHPELVVWAGLLPVITTAIFFELRFIFLVILIAMISLGFQGALLSPSGVSPGFLFLTASGFSAVGLLVVSFRRLQLSRHEKSRRDLVKASQEAEKSWSDYKQALMKAAQALNKNLDEQKILSALLSLSAQHISPDEKTEAQLASAVLLAKKSELPGAILQVACTRSFLPADEGLKLELAGGMIHRSLEERQPRFAKDMTRDPELLRFATLRSCRSVYCVPLVGSKEQDPIGVLLLAHPYGDFFTAGRRELFEGMALIAGLALRNARLYRNLHQERERLVELLQEHRKRLVRELHDGSTQSVSALALRANLIRRMFERDGKISVDDLQKMEDLARSTAKEMRQVLFTMRPLEQKPEGLIPSLESMAAHFLSSDGRNIVVESDPELVSALEPVKQAIIFYLVEEAIEIARRNGITGSIEVRVEAREPGLASLEIEFSRNMTSAAGGLDFTDGKNMLAISNMRERAALVNGIVDFEQVEGQGAILRTFIPVTEEAAERLRDRP